MKKVLLIDDSFFTLQRHQKLFSALGVETDLADSVKAARNFLKENRYDLVVTDLLMPEEDGIVVLKEMKSEHPDIPVVVVSADIQETRRQEVYDLGAAEHLSKPLDEAKLRELLGKMRLL